VNAHYTSAVAELEPVRKVKVVVPFEVRGGLVALGEGTDMLFRGHWAGLPGIKPGFGVVVDDETMTWRSDPPGHDLEQPFTAYFPRQDGALHKGKNFEVLPGGRAREVK
jgi:hypothetical protein